MDKWLYLLINIGSISIPFIAGFDKRLKFYQQWKFLFPAIILTMAIFIPWDMAKTYFNVWGFNPRYNLDLPIGNLPMEEWIFFIAIPYACLFTYHALNYLIKKDYLHGFADIFFVVAGIVLIILGLLNFDKTYTTITFISTGIFLLLHRFVFKSDYLGRFLMMYFITLIPFFIVNGLLTGSFIPEEVVYYDDTKNLGIRIGTIPIEDAVYGLFMLLMNTTWYEYFKSKFTQDNSLKHSSI